MADVSKDLFKEGESFISGLLIQLALTGSVGLGAVVFFTIMRPRNQQVYQPNKVLLRSLGRRGLQQFFRHAEVPEKLPEVSNSPLDWLKVVYNTTEQQVLESIGIDATVFVKFLGAVVKATLAMCACALVTLTLNYRSLMDGVGFNGRPNRPGRGDELKDFAITESILYAPHFLWGHVATAFVLSAYILYLFTQLWRDFVGIRQRYFRSSAYYNSIHARTMLVTNLTTSMLADNEALARAMYEVNVKHFRSCTLGLKVSTLNDAVKKREEYVLQLESVMHSAFYSKLEGYHPDSATNLALPGAALPPEAAKLCDKIRALDAQIYDMRRNGCEAKAIHAGFVEFDAPEECHEVVEQLRGRAAHGLRIEPAPRPADLIWRNLGTDPSTQQHLRRIGNGIVLAVCIGWIFPLGAIIPLSQPEVMLKYWPSLGLFMYNHRAFASLVRSMLPPMLLSAFLIVLPYIFRKVSDKQGSYTKAMRTKDTLRKLHLFYLVGYFVLLTAFSFFWKLLSGFSVDSIAKTVQGADAGAVASQILSKIQRTLLALATTYINRSVFWAGYVANGSGYIPVELARAVPLVSSFLKRRFMNLTPREEMLVNSPPAFDYDMICALVLFYFFLAMVYVWVQPFVPLLCALYTAFAYLVHKWQIMFVYGRGSDSAGEFWPTMYKRVVSSLLTAQGLLAAYLLCNTLWFTGGAMVVLLVATAYYGRSTYKTYLPKAMYFDPHHGPYDPEALRQDAEARRAGRRDRYLHPALVEHLILPLVDPRVEHLLEPYFPELSLGYRKPHDPRRDSAGSLSSNFNAFDHPKRPASPASSLHKDHGSAAPPTLGSPRMLPQHAPVRSPSPIGGMYHARAQHAFAAAASPVGSGSTLVHPPATYVEMQPTGAHAGPALAAPRNVYQAPPPPPPQQQQYPGAHAPPQFQPQHHVYTAGSPRAPGAATPMMRSVSPVHGMAPAHTAHAHGMAPVHAAHALPPARGGNPQPRGQPRY